MRTDGCFAGRDPDEPTADTAFADDVVFCAVIKDNLNIKRLVGELCNAVRAPLTRRGMAINWGRGKTGVMIALVGKYARAARRDLYTDHKLKLRVDVDGTAVFLKDAYKHLGGAVAFDGRMGREVAASRCAAAGATGPLIAKLTFGESLSMMRLYYNAAVWGRLTERQLRGLQADTLAV